MKSILSLGAAALLVSASGLAFAADLPGRRSAPAPMPVVYAPIFTWTGFYVGANAGYRFGHNRTDFRYSSAPPAGILPPGLKDDKGSFTGGVQAGYNYQIGSMVLGAEGDVNYLGAGKRQSFTGSSGLLTSSVSTQAKTDWLGTARVRAGFAFDRALVYGTGGLAFGNVKGSAAASLNTGAAWAGSKSDTAVGYAVGAGVEYALTNNLTTKVEYLYYNLGDQKTALTASGPAGGFTIGSKAKVDGNIVRAGLNYKF
jgi:outer membrane immunogenic protein